MKYLDEFYSFIDEMKRITDVLNPRIQDSTDLFILSSVASIIGSSECVVLLLKSGYQPQCDMLIRKISESSVHTINVAYLGQEYIDRMLINFSCSEISKCNFCMRRMKIDDEQSELIKSYIAEYENRISSIKSKRNWKFRETTIYNSFDILGELELYFSYKQLCDRSHSSVVSLAKDHALDSEEGYIDIQRPLPISDLSFSLCHAAEMMIVTFGTVLDYFDIETDLCVKAKEKYMAMKKYFDEADESN